MSYQLNFEEFLTYNVGDEGIGLDVEIRIGESNVRLNAKIDTGATYSIFERKFGEELSLEIESGMRQRFGTATGDFYGYGFRELLSRRVWSLIQWFSLPKMTALQPMFSAALVGLIR